MLRATGHARMVRPSTAFNDNSWFKPHADRVSPRQLISCNKIFLVNLTGKPIHSMILQTSVISMCSAVVSNQVPQSFFTLQTPEPVQ